VGLSPAKVVAGLFPKNQAAAARAYLNAISQYPDSYGISAPAFHRQLLAVQGWLTGRVAAGRREGDLRVPTLVAGGTRDQFMVTANVRLLARTVPGSKLLWFDDAGHAFWFQDAASFVRAVDSFIG
jgi:pimeloyl-ACP methyl ester carboxylesterase